MHMPSLPRFGYFISRHQQPIETAQSTTQLDVHGRGLQGLKGAQYIISTLKQRSTIQYLVLGNNSFGDDGVTTLFQFLSSDRGRRLKIVEISLNSCDIGNLGLRAVCGYLNGNMTLTSLFLQNNEFNPSWALCSTFTSAINSSRLKVLSLTSNPHLGDTFLFRFLPNICTPYLQELHLSAMGLTTISTPHVVAFLSTDLPASSSSSLSSSTSSSPPTTEEKPQLLSLLEVDKPQPTTRLRDLRLNGNSLTLPCAEKIVQALEHANFSVRHLEMYANRFNVGFWDPPPLQQLQLPVPPLLAPIHVSLTPTLTTSIPPASSVPEVQRITTWHQLKTKLSSIYARNHLLTTQARVSALRLLPIARCLLSPSLSLSSSSSASSSTSTSATMAWNKLPAELKQHILTLVWPALSPGQHIRIWRYASDRGTLQSLGGDPVMTQLRLRKGPVHGGGGGERASVAAGDKEEWLVLVGCERFEWYDGWQEMLASIEW